MTLRPYAVRCADRHRALAAAVERVVAACRSRSDVREAFVFGSFARDEVGPTSDLDVLIVRETTLGIVDRVADLKWDARGEVGLDLVVVTPNELATTFAASSFGRTVIAGSRRIYAA